MSASLAIKWGYGAMFLHQLKETWNDKCWYVCARALQGCKALYACAHLYTLTLMQRLPQMWLGLKAERSTLCCLSQSILKLRDHLLIPIVRLAIRTI